MEAKNQVRSEDAPLYHIDMAASKADTFLSDASEDEIIQAALQILDKRVARGVTIGSPTDAAQYLCLRNAQHKYQEVFSVIYLDSGNRIIEYREMFFGTLAQSAVFPREIMRAAIETGAASVVLCHNHPSGNVTPSVADEKITKRVKDALDYIDVRVLDHIITGGGNHCSFAVKGIL